MALISKHTAIPGVSTVGSASGNLANLGMRWMAACTSRRMAIGWGAVARRNLWSG